LILGFALMTKDPEDSPSVIHAWGAKEDKLTHAPKPSLPRLVVCFPLVGGGGGGGGGPQPPPSDCAEKVHVSSLALLKMLKHARAGVPMEVMGLMLGQFDDDYTINCVDVFAMPQSGTGVSVEAVDPVFQTKVRNI